MDLKFRGPLSEGDASRSANVAGMHILIDRANGNVLTEVSEADFKTLVENLTRESETDYDFYLNDATLAYLVEQGISEGLKEALQPAVDSRGLDMGWEKPRPPEGALYTGRVVDQSGAPLGGVRIDLLERVEADTNKPDTTLDVIDWTHSRNDGTFTLGLDESLPGSVWRASGRGDLELSRNELTALGDLGTLTIPILKGALQYQDGQPAQGVSVQLLGWTCLTSHDRVAKSDIQNGLTWGDSGADGAFFIPVNFPKTVDGILIQLELLALYGETLLETEVELALSLSYDIGTLVIPRVELPEEVGEGAV